MQAFQDAAAQAELRSNANNWALSHRKMVFKAPLPQSLEIRIRLWFKSLDKNCSGALNKEEMAAAMDMGTYLRETLTNPCLILAMAAAWYKLNVHNNYNSNR